MTFGRMALGRMAFDRMAFDRMAVDHTAVAIYEAKTKRERRTFIFLPERLYENRYPQWVHPIYRKERAYFNPRQNKAYTHSDVVLYLARRGTRTLGRVMVIVNHRLNKFRKLNQARFAHFDCINDQETASGLLNAAEAWARRMGTDHIVGPIGFNNTDNQGILVEGHRHRRAFGTWWHPEYTHSLIEGAGYVKDRDWVSYLIHVTPHTVPPAYARISERVLARTEYQLVSSDRRANLKPYVEQMFELVNRTFVDLGGFSPLTVEEIRRTARENMYLFDPRFFKLVILHGRLVGFSLGMPDMTAGIRAARGRLFPFGIFKMLRARKTSERLDVIVGAIASEHRGKGLDVLLATATYNSVLSAGMSYVDSHQEQESNYKSRREFERLGGKLYKRYRLYRKDL